MKLVEGLARTGDTLFVVLWPLKMSERAPVHPGQVLSDP